MVAEKKDQKKATKGKEAESKKPLSTLKSKINTKAKEDHEMSVGTLLGWSFLMIKIILLKMM